MVHPASSGATSRGGWEAAETRSGRLQTLHHVRGEAAAAAAAQYTDGEQEECESA